MKEKTEKTNSLTTVAYSKSLTDKLSGICKKLGINKTAFIDAAILKYHQTGEDPRESIKESLPKQIITLENRIIGFIKTQDTKYLQEIVKSLETIEEVQKSGIEKEKSERDGVSNKIKSMNDTIQELYNYVNVIELKDESGTLRQVDHKIAIFNRVSNILNGQTKTNDLINSNTTKIEKLIGITQSKKEQAIKELNAKKGTLGNVSVSDAIEIISKM